MRTKFSWKRLAALIALFFLTLGGIYIFQDKLIFPGRTQSPGDLEWIKRYYPAVQEIIVETTDGVELYGWHLPAEHPGEQPLVIYYGGNASLASDMLPYTGRFSGRGFLAVDFRGYGRSGGKPREDLLYADALHIYDLFAARDDVDSSRIILMGFSLGTTVAAHVAARRPVQAVVLAAPFESVSEIIRRRVPILPLYRMVRNPMDASASAQEATAPLLTLMADRDRVIPNRHSLALSEMWGGDSSVQVISGRGHDDMHLDRSFWKHIDCFLADK